MNNNTLVIRIDIHHLTGFLSDIGQVCQFRLSIIPGETRQQSLGITIEEILAQDQDLESGST